jgi:holo-[acyl-carrier protein] synthase
MAMLVGIDLVSVNTVRESMRDHGDRYLERIYTAAELRDCRDAEGIMPERLAARFAAKEATIKVLRPADEAIPWQSIEVVRHPSGWVELELSGRAATSAANQGLGDFALSVSHEGGFATAVVIAHRP